jgi:hypothetical protein
MGIIMGLERVTRIEKRKATPALSAEVASLAVAGYNL